jgi:hypothetical protein
MERSFHLRGEGLDLTGRKLLFWVTVGKTKVSEKRAATCTERRTWTPFKIAVGTDRVGRRRSWAREKA